MKSSTHILVIRLSAMGDVAMTVPVLKVVTETYPELRITVLTRKFFAPLFSELPNVSVYEAEVRGKHKGIFGLKRLAKELRNKNIDAVADLHNVLRSNILKYFFKAHGIPVKQIDKGRTEKKALTRKKNKVFKQLKTTHQRYAEVFAVLGFPIALSKFHFLKKKVLSPKILNFTGQKNQKWLGIAPFAAHASKTYPLDLMEKVLKELQEMQGLKIFLFGAGNHEKVQLKEWEKEFENIKNAAGKFSLEDELILISNLDAMLSMDSGNGHLAANYGIPVITLWGLTHPFTGFAPFKQPKENQILPDLEKYPQIPTSVYGKKIPPGYEGVMREIPPGKVVERIKNVVFSS